MGRCSVLALVLVAFTSCDKGQTSAKTESTEKTRSAKPKDPKPQDPRPQDGHAGKTAKKEPVAKRAPGEIQKIGELVWQTSEAKALALSKEQKKPVFADFRADWCAPCVELDEQTFVDPKVATVLREEYVLLRVDATDPDEATDKLMLKYEAKQLPLLLVIEDGAIKTRISEFVEPSELLKRLGH